MSTNEASLRDLLVDGRISLSAPPALADDPAIRRVLREAYAVRALSVAGPALAFEEKTALAAGRLLLHAAWYFLNPGLPIETPEKLLSMPTAPRSPEQHLSGDLVLRLLPTLQRRAKALMKDDVLPTALERVLRQWPLSGVLADIVEPPLAPVDFGTHPGLNFLYAERLAKHERPGWFPLGHGMQYVELVWQALGKDVSVLPAQCEVSAELSTRE